MSFRSVLFFLIFNCCFAEVVADRIVCTITILHGCAFVPHAGKSLGVRVCVSELDTIERRKSVKECEMNECIACVRLSKGKEKW